MYEWLPLEQHGQVQFPFKEAQPFPRPLLKQLLLCPRPLCIFLPPVLFGACLITAAHSPQAQGENKGNPLMSAQHMTRLCCTFIFLQNPYLEIIYSLLNQ